MSYLDVGKFVHPHALRSLPLKCCCCSLSSCSSVHLVESCLFTHDSFFSASHRKEIKFDQLGFFFGDCADSAVLQYQRMTIREDDAAARWRTFKLCVVGLIFCMFTQRIPDLPRTGSSRIRMAFRVFRRQFVVHIIFFYKQVVTLTGNNVRRFMMRVNVNTIDCLLSCLVAV